MHLPAFVHDPSDVGAWGNGLKAMPCPLSCMSLNKEHILTDAGCKVNRCHATLSVKRVARCCRGSSASWSRVFGILHQACSWTL